MLFEVMSRLRLFLFFFFLLLLLMRPTHAHIELECNNKISYISRFSFIFSRIFSFT